MMRNIRRNRSNKAGGAGGRPEVSDKRDRTKSVAIAKPADGGSRMTVVPGPSPQSPAPKNKGIANARGRGGRALAKGHAKQADKGRVKGQGRVKAKGKVKAKVRDLMSKKAGKTGASKGIENARSKGGKALAKGHDKDRSDKAAKGPRRTMGRKRRALKGRAGKYSRMKTGRTPKMNDEVRSAISRYR